MANFGYLSPMSVPEDVVIPLFTLSSHNIFTCPLMSEMSWKPQEWNCPVDLFLTDQHRLYISASVTAEWSLDILAP